MTMLDSLWKFSFSTVLCVKEEVGCFFAVVLKVKNNTVKLSCQICEIKLSDLKCLNHMVQKMKTDIFIFLSYLEK